MGSSPLLPPLRPWIASQRLRSSPPLSQAFQGPGLRPRRPGSRPGEEQEGGFCRGVPTPQSSLNPRSDTRVGDQGERRTAAPLSLGSFWGLSPSRSPALASHPRPNPNSSSPASRALSFITNNNDAYRIAWTYPTSSDPTPALPRGPPPSSPGIRCWRTDPGARQAGLGTAHYTPLCIRFAGKAPWGGCGCVGFLSFCICTFYL